MMEKQVKTLCDDCTIRLGQVLRLAPVGMIRMDKCQECGRKTIVQEFRAEVRKRK